MKKKTMKISKTEYNNYYKHFLIVFNDHNTIIKCGR